MRVLCTTGHPVGVPGTLSGVATILNRFGTFSLAQAMAPAIAAARNGVPMTTHLHHQIEVNKERLQWFPASKALLLNEDGTAPVAAAGELWTNPHLADTLEEIARDGIESFYGGSIGQVWAMCHMFFHVAASLVCALCDTRALAQDIVNAVQAAVNPLTNKTGLMELSDLQQYKAVERIPSTVTYA